jgi:hypothetical protein
LAGRGIRELTVDGNWIWLIAGPPQDSEEPFQLLRFPVADLQPEAIIKPEFIMELPTSSEGLAIDGANAYIVIDGDTGDSNSACEKPGRYQVIPLSG